MGMFDDVCAGNLTCKLTANMGGGNTDANNAKAMN